MNTIKINEQERQFEIQESGLEACITYHFIDGGIELLGTFVPKEFEGKGIGSALAKFALEYVKEKEMKALICCPFILAYVKRHPEYNSLQM